MSSFIVRSGNSVRLDGEHDYLERTPKVGDTYITHEYIDLSKMPPDKWFHLSISIDLSDSWRIIDFNGNSRLLKNAYLETHIDDYDRQRVEIDSRGWTG